MNIGYLPSLKILYLRMTETKPEQASLDNLDPQAITAVYNRYFAEIFRYVRFRLGDETLAEDISSEVFLRLLKAVKAGCGPRTNLRGWLFGITRHMVIDHIRQKYRHPVEAIEETL